MMMKKFQKKITKKNLRLKRNKRKFININARACDFCCGVARLASFPLTLVEIEITSTLGCVTGRWMQKSSTNVVWALNKMTSSSQCDAAWDAEMRVAKGWSSPYTAPSELLVQELHRLNFHRSERPPHVCFLNPVRPLCHSSRHWASHTVWSCTAHKTAREESSKPNFLQCANTANLTVKFGSISFDKITVYPGV